LGGLGRCPKIGSGKRQRGYREGNSDRLSRRSRVRPPKKELKEGRGKKGRERRRGAGKRGKGRTPGEKRWGGTESVKKASSQNSGGGGVRFGAPKGNLEKERHQEGVEGQRLREICPSKRRVASRKGVQGTVLGRRRWSYEVL